MSGACGRGAGVEGACVRVGVSGLDLLEADASFDKSGEVGVNGIKARDAMDKCGGADEVGTLHEFEAGFFQIEARPVERTSLMGDENDALEFVNLNEKLEFVNDALFFEVGLRMTCEAGRPTGE